MADRSETAFGETLKDKDPGIQAAAWTARDLILEVFPNATEVVWIKDGNATYGTGPDKYRQHFLWLQAHKKHVTVGFYYGVELADPEGLLEGEGKRIRHVKLRSVDDVQRAGVRALLEAAVQAQGGGASDGPVSIRR